MTNQLRRRLLVGAFFSVLALVGLRVFSDYGVPWDEPNARENGARTVEFLLSGDAGVLAGHLEQHHGAAYETLLALLEKALGLTDLRSAYLMRHLANYLFFCAGLWAFYRLAAARFDSWGLGLLGAALLALSPRIFADAFYNSKDIPCLVLFIVSAWTLLRFLEKKTPARALAHAAACAFLIDVRIVGLLMPLLTAGFFLLDEGASRRAPWRSLAVFLAATAALSWLLWPALWGRPLSHLLATLREQSNTPWPSSVLYLGRYIKGSGLPWHYIPVWVLVTTPPFYTALFAAGAFSLAAGLAAGPRRFYRDNKADLLFAAWLFLPLAWVALARPTLYDAWRHFFFIYPAFLLLALRGWRELVGAARPRARRWLQAGLAFGLATTAVAMARLHPYQNLYFNRLAGRDMASVKTRFELDYWGLSFSQAMGHILAEDRRPRVKFALAAYPLGLAAVNILAAEDRRRVDFPSDPKDPADYFLSNYRWHNEEYPYPNPYYSIEVGGTKILVVYKREGA